MQPTAQLQSQPPPDATSLSGRRDRHGLPAGEEIITWQHPHWIVLVRSMIGPGVLVIVALISFLLINGINLAGAGDAAALAAALLAGAVLMLLLGALLWTAYTIWDWWADWFVVTNRRLIIREATPLRRENRREVPLNKVQNVQSTLPGMLNQALGYGRVTVDTAGLGTVIFEDVPKPDRLRGMILDQQKAAAALNQPGREQYRQQIIRSILYGLPMPPAPPGVAIAPSPRMGFGLFNTLFPFRPQRDGMTVIWHKHWWFFLKAELWPFLIILFFELTNWVLRVASGLLGDADVVGTPIAFLRPLIWLIVLLVALYQWEDWRNDYYEVRADAVIDREALPLGLSQQTKETKLNRITDISNDVPGPLAMLLGYGNIVIKTPGESTDFDFKGVPNPGAVLGEIMDRIEAEREKEQAQISRELQDWLRSYTSEIQYYQQWAAQRPAAPGS